MNFNLFKKPPMNNGSEKPETVPPPHSPEVSRNLMMIAAFLLLMSQGASAKSPDVLHPESINPKAKTNQEDLLSKMISSHTDTLDFKRGEGEKEEREYKIINHNGSVSYVEVGGGNTITIIDGDGDGLANSIHINGYADQTGMATTNKIIGNRRVDVNHVFNVTKNDLSKLSVSSTLRLTRNEEYQSFLSAQAKVESITQEGMKELGFQGQEIVQK